jgi:hypothetical protein
MAIGRVNPEFVAHSFSRVRWLKGVGIRTRIGLYTNSEQKIIKNKVGLLKLSEMLGEFPAATPVGPTASSLRAGCGCLW